jgi:hypothetical protein
MVDALELSSCSWVRGSAKLATEAWASDDPAMQPLPMMCRACGAESTLDLSAEIPTVFKCAACGVEDPLGDDFAALMAELPKAFRLNQKYRFVAQNTAEDSPMREQVGAELHHNHTEWLARYYRWVVSRLEAQ